MLFPPWLFFKRNKVWISLFPYNPASCMFLGEIGGNMGLFLGCSLLTIFEFIDVIIRIATRRGRQVLHMPWRHTGAEASVKPTDAILNAYIFSSTEAKLRFKQRKLYQTSSADSISTSIAMAFIFWLTIYSYLTFIFLPISHIWSKYSKR